MAIAASLMVALIAGLLIFALLTGRLRRLNAAVDQFKKGTPLNDITLPRIKDAESGDEIRQLTFTFKTMAERLESQMNKLQFQPGGSPWR